MTRNDETKCHCLIELDHRNHDDVPHWMKPQRLKLETNYLICRACPDGQTNSKNGEVPFYIPDESMSRRHAILWCGANAGGGLQLRIFDDSTNGTFVNDEKIDRRCDVLKHVGTDGNLIMRFGLCAFQFRVRCVASNEPAPREVMVHEEGAAAERKAKDERDTAPGAARVQVAADENFQASQETARPAGSEKRTNAVFTSPSQRRQTALVPAPLQQAAKRFRAVESESAEQRPKRQCTGEAGGSNGSNGPSGGARLPKCDKCDGPHSTDACPHFKKSREEHKDAWANYGKKHPSNMGRSGGKFVLKGARMVRQPGDGSCLFHSLSFGLNGGRPNGHTWAGQLRKELAQFVTQNAQLEIAGDTLQEWIKWDTNRSVAAYTRQMAVGGWGGGIEMAACSILKGVNVHVYESKGYGGFKRISCFDSPKPTSHTIHILYQGGVHYDALAV